jgi:nucleotide-binding universal stress UspA family protein
MAEDQRIRVLLPSRPEDNLEDVSRVLRALVPAAATHVRRLYVHRPVTADFYIPDSYSRIQEISQLEFDAENATRIETEREMKSLAAEGFQVSAEVIRGTPTEEILQEATFWRADLVGVRTRSLAAEDQGIGGMASALLYHGTCPVLTHHAVPPGYRIRRILIPTDFSEASRRSAHWALALAGVTGAEPILLHVIARRAYRHGIDPDELSEIAAREVEAWRSRLDPMLPGLVSDALVIAAETPTEGILSFAKERSCDLIVLAATGASAVRAMLLGSNTRKVVRASACPVLVVPASNRVTAEAFLRKARALAAGGAPREGAGKSPAGAEKEEPPKRFRRVLVATDLTPASTPAVKKAIGLAAESGAELILAHAYQPPSLILEGYVPPATYDSWDESIQSDVRRKLQPYLDDAEKAGVTARVLILTGTPEEAIIGAARDCDADLVVMGTHGRTGVPRFFLGSVASRVISTAPCPVMTVGRAVEGQESRVESLVPGA